jgi:hypothetical protein
VSRWYSGRIVRSRVTPSRIAALAALDQRERFVGWNAVQIQKSPSDKVRKAAMVLKLCAEGVRELVTSGILLIEHVPKGKFDRD